MSKEQERALARIVILNRVDPERVRYNQVIDHDMHEVTYIGQFLDGVSPARARIVTAKLSDLDPDALPALIEEACANCDCLVARGERDLILAAQIRERFNIPGDTVAKVLPIRDKLTMRMSVRGSTVRQPAFWSLAQYKRASGRIPLHQTLVLKPRLDAASNGIWIGSRNELDARVETLRETDWLVEEYIPGDILHLDGLLQGGKLDILQASKYVNTCFSYAAGSALGSTQIENPEWASTAVTELSRLLNYSDGGFHLEMIVDGNGQPHFLEFAGRIGGAYIAEAFELKTGVNLHHADLRCAIGETANVVLGRGAQDMFGWFLFPYGANLDCGSVRQTFDDQFVRCLINAQPTRPDVPSYSEIHSPFCGIVRKPSSCEDVIHEIVRHVTAVPVASAS
ncbi:ATP-grasp domain-containing protein [Agrobacterium tumefaciens]|uniref:ATP-grasp domain-containing protein n=1 Tax=Agrobacterium tumefaciens TaxID=358 RepID=UPI0016484FAB|nr:ATP-grasp domain-containing protein [Agrobacterium tumefaciens]